MIKPDNIEQREEAARLYEEAVAADIAVNDAPQSMPDEEFAALDLKATRARLAANNHPLEILIDNDGDVARCGVCNAPLMADDELLEDPVTGESFLRSALGLPPRETDSDSEEEAA